MRKFQSLSLVYNFQTVYLEIAVHKTFYMLLCDLAKMSVSTSCSVALNFPVFRLQIIGKGLPCTMN